MGWNRVQARMQLALKKVPPLFHALKWSRDTVRSSLGPRRLKAQVSRLAASGEPIRIIIGAGLADRDPGWIPTDVQYLDLLDDRDWQRAFGDHRIDALLAEHVWEHLTPADGRTAAAQCLKYLKPGGRLRIAVPDANHPDPAYYEFVRPGGPGPGASDHKILYTYQTLGDMLRDVGFEVDLLEYYDAEGNFHRTPWNQTDGRIMRCDGFKEPKPDGGYMNYTSLLVDGRKPIKTSP
jgi:predicted SAM-dependent methyltransferase